MARIFATGQKPTGAKDPFGLRRAAIGVLRLLIELKVDPQDLTPGASLDTISNNARKAKGQ